MATSTRWVLSDREREVMALLALGLTNKAIAERLYVSPETVKSHLIHIYRKLGVSSRSGAVAAWRAPPVPSDMAITGIRVRLANGEQMWFACEGAVSLTM